MSELIDTTEMYLRTIFELEEEGIVPMRARITERLGQSGPTVSQTVARMERDGLVSVEGDRHLRLSESGRSMAARVMRKHRLAECLLIEVLGVPWEEVHAEACRWEHVMSETVERRVLEILDHPDASPFGNPIPGLDELGHRTADGPAARQWSLADCMAGAGGTTTLVTVRRIDEPIQTKPDLMFALRRAGAHPGETIKAENSPGGILLGSAGEYTEIDTDTARHIVIDCDRPRT